MFWKIFRKEGLPVMLFTGIVMKLIDIFVYKEYEFGFYHLLMELTMWIIAALVLSFCLVHFVYKKNR